MAEPSDQKKPKSRFGMIMGSVSRSAKKSLSRAGKQMAKGAVKAKQAAVEKIAKVPISEQDPQIVSALQQLKITKTEIYEISDLARNLFDSSLHEPLLLLELSDTLKHVQTLSQTVENDPFVSFSQKMSVDFSNLHAIKCQYLQDMEQQFVNPLETFREINVEKVQTLKLKYKNGKTQFDISAHKLTKAQESKDQTKINTAQQKKHATYTQLMLLSKDMQSEVNNLEQNKNGNLLCDVEKYWASYARFAAAQSHILSQKIIEKENVNVDNVMEVKNEEYDNDVMQYENDVNVSGDGEYFEENDNGPTAGYNPFGD